MIKENNLKFEFSKGIWNENPVLRQLLGMCPTLAVTTTALNGLTMGLATTFVLVSSSIIISIFRKLIPHQIRIPVFTIIIATFVTIADFFLAAEYHKLSKELGPYVPLIVVNCIILGRQEAFASKNPLHKSFVDAFGMGIGFIFTLVILGSIREILSNGTVFNFILIENLRSWIIMLLPAGAFISLGFLVALMNFVSNRRQKSDDRGRRLMEKMIKTVKDLKVYNRGYKLAMEIFEITKKFPKEETYSLTDQIRRSSRSVAINIREGFAKRKYE